MDYFTKISIMRQSKTGVVSRAHETMSRALFFPGADRSLNEFTTYCIQKFLRMSLSHSTHIEFGESQIDYRTYNGLQKAVIKLQAIDLEITDDSEKAVEVFSMCRESNPDEKYLLAKCTCFDGYRGGFRASISLP